MTYDVVSQPVRDMHTLQKELLVDVQDLRKEVDTMVANASTWHKIYSKLNDKFKVNVAKKGSG